MDGELEWRDRALAAHLFARITKEPDTGPEVTVSEEDLPTFLIKALPPLEIVTPSPRGWAEGHIARLERELYEWGYLNEDELPRYLEEGEKWQQETAAYRADELYNAATHPPIFSIQREGGSERTLVINPAYIEGNARAIDELNSHSAREVIPRTTLKSWIAATITLHDTLPRLIEEKAPFQKEFRKAAIERLAAQQATTELDRHDARKVALLLGAHARNTRKNTAPLLPTSSGNRRHIEDAQRGVDHVANNGSSKDLLIAAHSPPTQTAAQMFRNPNSAVFDRWIQERRSWWERKQPGRPDH